MLYETAVFNTVPFPPRTTLTFVLRCRCWRSTLRSENLCQAKSVDSLVETETLNPMKDLCPLGSAGVVPLLAVC